MCGDRLLFIIFYVFDSSAQGCLFFAFCYEGRVFFSMSEGRGKDDFGRNEKG